VEEIVPLKRLVTTKQKDKKKSTELPEAPVPEAIAFSSGVLRAPEHKESFL